MQQFKLTELYRKENEKRTNNTKGSLRKQKDATRSAYASMGQSVQSFSASINQYLVYALQAATLSMAALSVQVIRVGAQFEQAVATLGAIRGQAGEALKPFEDQARLLGETTAFTATEAARGMQELARAGMQTSDIISSSNSALKFAGANATDMTTSTTLLAATMAQFGLSASQSTRVVDVFTTSLQNSLLNVQTLQVAMRYAGAVGASFGRSLEETTAMVALFRDLGLEGSTAGTQFRQSFLRLASPTKKAKAVLEEYGIALEDINPRVRTFQQILQTLADSGIAADLPAIKELVSIRAAGSFSKILSDVADGSSKLSTLLAAFEKGAGVTEKTYTDMINTVSGQTDILKSVAEETFLRIFDIFTLKGFDEKSNPIINVLKSLQQIFQDINIALFQFTTVFQSEIESVSEQLNTYLQQNSAQIAASFVSLIVSLKDFVGFLISIRETLKSIFKGLLVFTAISTVVKTATAAVKALSVAIVAVKGTFALIRGEIALTYAALAGPVGLVAGLTAAAAAWYYLAKAEEDYNNRQEKLKLQIEGNKEAVEAYNEALKESFLPDTDQLQQGKLKDRELSPIEAFDIQQAQSQFEILQKLVNLRVDDKLIQSLQEELNVVKNLTEEQKVQQLQQGKLVMVTLDGNRKILMSQVAIERFKKIAFENSEELYRDEIALNVAQQDAIKELELEVVNLKNSFQAATNAIAAQKNPSNQLVKIAEKYETKLVLTEQRLKNLKNAIAEAATEEERSAAITRTQIELAEALDERQKQSIANNEAEAESLDALNAAILARLDLERQIAEARVEQFGTTQEKATLEELKRVEEIEKVFHEEQKLREQHGKELIDLNEYLYETLRQDRLNRYAEELSDIKDQVERANKARLNSVDAITAEQTQLERELVTRLNRIREQEKTSLSNRLVFLEKHFKDTETALFERFNNEEITQEEYLQKRKANQDFYDSELEVAREESDQRILESHELLNQLRLQGEIETAQKILKVQDDYRKGFNQVNVDNISSIKDFSDAISQLREEQTTLFQDMKTGADVGLYNELSTRNTELQAEAFKKLTTSLFGVKDASKGLQSIDFSGSFIDLTNLQDFDEAIQDTVDGLRTVLEIDPTDSAAKLQLLTINMTKAGLVAQSTQTSIEKMTQAISDRLPSGLREVFDLFRTGINSVRNLRKQFFDFNDIVSVFSKIRKDGLFGSLFKEAGVQIKSAKEKFNNFTGSLKDFKGTWQSAKDQFRSPDFWADLFKKLLRFKDLFKNIGKAAVKAAIAISKVSIEKLKGGLDFLTGGANFNPFEIVNDALSEFSKLSEDAAEKQKKLQEQLASGSITQAEFDEANAMLEQQKEQGATPEQIQAFANKFVTQISDRIKMIAQVAGPVLQAIAAEIPNLVQTFVAEIPKIVSSLAAALPQFFFAILDGLTAVFNSLTQQIKNTSSEAASAFFSELSTKMVGLIGSFTGFITTAIQQIVANLPQIIGGLTEVINGLFNAIGEIAVTLISNLPQITTALLDAVANILTNLGPILGKIITAIADMLPGLLISLADALPKLLGSIGNVLAEVLVALAGAIPKVITAFMNAFPRIITGLIEGALELIVVIVEAVPDIIVALVAALPDLFIAIITRLPRLVIELVALIIRKLPEIAYRLVIALLYELPLALVEAARSFAINFVEGIKQFFKDAIQRIKDALNPFSGNDDNKGNNTPSKVDDQKASIKLDDDRTTGEKIEGFLPVRCR